MKSTFWLVVIAMGCVLNTEAAHPVYTGWFSKLGLGGYDAVSFFSENGPVKGSRDFTAYYLGVVWQFADAENHARFKANPEAYAPQYGGYCAWAAAQNKLAPGDPKFWKIIDGKLYLNYDAKVQKDWEKNIAEFIRKADQNWPDLIE